MRGWRVMPLRRCSEPEDGRSLGRGTGAALPATGCPFVCPSRRAAFQFTLPTLQPPPQEKEVRLIDEGGLFSLVAAAPAPQGMEVEEAAPEDSWDAVRLRHSHAAGPCSMLFLRSVCVGCYRSFAA